METSDTPLLLTCSILGCSIDLTRQGIDPFDIRASLAGSSKAVIVAMSSHDSDITPRSGHISSQTILNSSTLGSSRYREKYVIYGTGSEVAEKFAAEPDMSAGYAGVSTSASSQYSYETPLKDARLYGIYSLDQQV